MYPSLNIQIKKTQKRLNAFDGQIKTRAVKWRCDISIVLVVTWDQDAAQLSGNRTRNTRWSRASGSVKAKRTAWTKVDTPWPALEIFCQTKFTMGLAWPCELIQRRRRVTSVHVASLSSCQQCKSSTYGNTVAVTGWKYTWPTFHHLLLKYNNDTGSHLSEKFTSVVG